MTQEQLQNALEALHINIDLSAYATKEELQQAISNIDLSGYATTEYVDNKVANIPSGGETDLSNYYTKAETYNKEEVDNLIPTVTNGKDGKDGAGGGSSGGGGEVYSTEEIEIGTWIDGRAIYRKTFVLSETLANTVQFYEMDIEFEEIISINAINNYNSATFKPLNICEHDTYFNLSSNSVSNIKSALTKKCMVVYVFKDATHPLGRIYTWLGDRGGTLYKVYVTVDYIKPTSNEA